MELLKLIGIVIIVVGFMLKLDTLAVVVLAAMVTGLVSGLDIMVILSELGSAFVTNRVASIFLISFPVIAIIERYGLKERAGYLISQIKGATAGRILSLWMIIRSIASALSLRIGGHVQFIRPLIQPMALAAGEKQTGGKLNEKTEEEIKGLSAAVENYGNFFGQNCFYGASGVILIQTTLAANGYDVTLQQIAFSSLYVFVGAIIIAIAQFLLADVKMNKGAKK